MITGEKTIPDGTVFKKVSLKGMTVIVTGFPRSGTSMMMRMLDAGGVRIIQDTDENSPKHKYDPHGMKELGDVGSRIKLNKKKWTKNKAVKIVTPYAEWYPIDRPFKAIFMQRDINEIITSLMAMKSVWDVDISESIEWARGYLQHNNIPTLFIKYRETLKFPKTTALRIQDFLGVNLNLESMVFAVDPNARNKYKEDKTLLGHDFPETILRIDGDAYKDMDIKPVIYNMPEDRLAAEKMAKAGEAK